MFLQDHKSLIFTRIGIFSSELMPAYSAYYMVYDEQKLYYIPCCWAVLKSPWTILFTTFRLAASFFDYNKVRG